MLLYQLYVSILAECYHGFDAERKLSHDCAAVAKSRGSWRSLRTGNWSSGVPLGLAFSRATQKLSSIGYHWAPASLMGDLECKELAWAGPPALWESLDATPTDNGLLVVLPALTFVSGGRYNLAKRSMLKRCSTEMELMSHLELRCNAGNWYKCDIDQQWHQNRPVSAPCDGGLAIVLQSSFTKLNGLIIG